MSATKRTAHILLYALGNYTHPNTKHSIAQWVLPHVIEQLRFSGRRPELILDRKHDCWLGSGIVDHSGGSGEEAVRTSNQRVTTQNPKARPFKLTLAKPRLLMNVCGRPLPFLLRTSSIDKSHSPVIPLILHDNLTLSPQTLGKIRYNVSHQGHGGLKSVEKATGSPSFHRLGLGIGRSGSVVDWVLSEMSGTEKGYWEGEGAALLASEIVTFAAKQA